MSRTEQSFSEIGGVPIYYRDDVARERIDALAAASGVTYFGRVWNLANSTPVADHYVGSLAFGQELPQWLGLGCYLVTNDHKRTKLNTANHYKTENGAEARLDGTMGHYQWGWGKKFYIVVKQTADELAIIVAKGKIPGEYNLTIPIATDSAAGWATMERTTGRLVSYINDTINYRGGNNTASYDAAYNTLLGRPASSMTTNAFLTAARLNGDGWLGSCGRFVATEAMLFYVIFGTLKIDTPWSGTKDANGLYQGGLGTGPVNAGSWWGKAVAEGGFGYEPVIPLSAGIELGDRCGVFTYDVHDGNGDMLQTMQCYSFFGHKNSLGGIMWRMMTDELLRCNSDGSQTHLVAETIRKVNDAWTYGIGESASGFREGATGPAAETAGWSYITRIKAKNLELFPLAVGGDSATRFADVYYNPAATSGFRLVRRSGNLSRGGVCGPSVVHGYDGVGYAFVYDGSSLCEVDEEWPVDAEYVEV